jgi:hypothetical protein
MVDQMTPEERAELDRELDTSAERESLIRAQTEHEAAQREIREERIRRAPEVKAAHAARMKAIADEFARAEALDSSADRAKYSPKKTKP